MSTPLKFIVPYVKNFQRLDEVDLPTLRSTVMECEDPSICVPALGRLIKLDGLGETNTPCIVRALSSDDAELRGSVIATVSTAIRTGIQIQSRKLETSLVDLLRRETCEYLRPWCLVLRSQLSDSSALEEAVAILSGTDPAMQIGDGEVFSRIHRALQMAARMVRGQEPPATFMY